MDQAPSLGNTNATGLGKLLPKAIAEKRRRRKKRQQQQELEDRADSNSNSNSWTDGETDSQSDKRTSWVSTASHDSSVAHQHQLHQHQLQHQHQHQVHNGISDPRNAQAATADATPSHVGGGRTRTSIDAAAADSSSHRPNAVSTISTHPSQIGYLTTHSPLVQAAHLPEPQSLEVQPFELASRSSTFSSRRPESVESDSRRSSLSTRSKTGGLIPPAKEARRSPSPVGKIKGVFNRSRKNLAGSAGVSPSTSPERKAVVADDQHQRIPDDTSEPSSRPPTAQSDGASSTAAKSTTATSQSGPEPPQSHSDVSQLASPATTARISVGRPPATPPNNDTTPGPVIINTPPTPTERQSSTFSPTPSPKKPSDAPTSTSPWGNLTSYKRGRSGSAGPSKLSNTTFAPLSPTAESPPTAGSNNSPSSGFFSSMLSAAQNAANQLSNTIQTANNQSPTKNRSVTATRDQPIPEEDKPEVDPPLEALGISAMDKEPAVKTLGEGDLTLNQLGIVEPPSVSGTPMTSKFPDLAETRTRSESAPADASSATSHEYADETRGPNTTRSLYEPGILGDRTPPPSSIYEEKLGSTPGVGRSGSIRSAVNGRRRNRGSSTTTRGTGTTIGAAIAAANASVANPSHNNASQQRLTGFAVSSKKRNRDFHALFKSVPDDDYLIEDYSCALQREILAHGRLYVSEGHLCFSSNILGWTTTLVMSFDEIVSVEKRSTALLFKNGLMISTLHAKHIFASFTSRDSTYDLIVNIWKLGHPSLKSSLNGVQLEGTGGDKTEKVDVNDMGEAVDGGQSYPDSRSMSGSEEESEDGDDVYDEDEDDDDDLLDTQPTEPGVDSDPDKVATRKASAALAANGAGTEAVKDGGPPAPSDDFPGPAAHAPTDCGDAATHYDKVVGDDIIPAPLGKVYNLLFGPASVTWLSKWIVNEAKCWDLQMEDKKGMSLENKTRTYSYMKPLPGAIGPRQTKCIVSETIEYMDLEKAVNVVVSTQTPDVPSGNAFTVKTKYCLSWADNNSTKFHANCTVDWSAKSWLRGPITSACGDGQTSYCNDLCASLKAAVTSRPRSGTGSARGGQKKKKTRKGRNARAAAENEEPSKHAKHVPKQDWGIFEALRPVLGPILDILKPLLTGNVVYGLLVGLLVAAWFGVGFPSNGSQRAVNMYGYPDRLAAYEEMWRREESELWDWLEERVGLERLNEGRMPTRKPIEARTVEEKVREERMDEREIQEAIRVTEEKLNVLKGVMNNKKQDDEPRVQRDRPSASEL